MIEKFKIMQWNVKMSVDNNQGKTNQFASRESLSTPKGQTRFGVWKEGKWVDFDKKDIKSIIDSVSK